VGAAAALAFHVACLRDLIAVCVATLERLRAMGHGAEGHIFLTPPGSEAAFAAAGVAWPGSWHVHQQEGETLGSRMAHALEKVIGSGNRAGPPDGVRALLCGSDVPLVTTEHLLRGFSALADADAVFGPTPDGGYHLVGLTQPAPQLFELAAWGHGGVLAQTLARGLATGLPARLLAPLPDVDTQADIAAVLEHPLASQLHDREALRLLRDWRESGGDDPAGT
jgi:glycosyltransferase A (GT-A) superfamily protein (DUF2064 family)